MIQERRLLLPLIIADKTARFGSARWQWIFAILMFVGAILIGVSALLLLRESAVSDLSDLCAGIPRL